MTEKKPRVLIVDDAVVVRSVVRKAIDAAEDLEVAATASNGKIALQKMRRDPADLVVLDFEMPEMDGMSTLDVLSKEFPGVPVIMFSTLTVAGARVTVEALTRGAADFCPKPSTAVGMVRATDLLENELLPKIRALTGCTSPTATPQPAARPRPPVPRPTPPRRSEAPKTQQVLPAISRPAPISVPAMPRPAAPMPPTAPLMPAVRPTPQRRGKPGSGPAVLVIGSSTGGPNALSAVVSKLRAPLNVPIVIVQHMPATFTAMLAERLSRDSALDFAEAGNGETLAPGKGYVAPGGFHLRLDAVGGKLVTRLSQDAPVNFCRPSVDVTLLSAVECSRERVSTVILTGMGHDGRDGCAAVRKAGGRVVAQDRESCTVWGMPRAVVEADLAHAEMSLRDIAADIRRQFAGSAVARVASL